MQNVHIRSVFNAFVGFKFPSESQLSLSNQQRPRFNAQGLGQPRNDLNRWVADAAFNAADIGAVEVGTKSKLLLREAKALPFSPQIFPNDQPDVHAGCEGWRSL